MSSSSPARVSVASLQVPKAAKSFLMQSLVDFSQQLRAGTDLSVAQISMAASALASAEVPDSEKSEFLVALSDKGEKAHEVSAFAHAFRGMAIDPGVGDWSSRAIDIVGTGGDHAGGFNVSSLVVLTLACAGVPVMKHGNRGVTSKCGSADLLGALGFDITASPEKLRGALRELGYAFFFAQNFHPSFRHIAPVRKALGAQGRRTVFNILGPLINPGRPAHTLLGVFCPHWVPIMADAMHTLGTRAGLAVHGVIDSGGGIDELTTATENLVRGAGQLHHLSYSWDAPHFGLPRSPFADLIGGDLQFNLSLVEAILAGHGPAGLVDTIVLNSAIAYWVTGHVTDPREAIPQMRELLVGGAVKARIKATREFFS